MEELCSPNPMSVENNVMNNILKRCTDLLGGRYSGSYLMDRTLDIVPELCSSLDAASNPPDGASVGHAKEVGELLCHMSEICNPKELLLALLEQADTFKSSTKYRTLLNPVGRCIERLKDKGQSIDLQFKSLAIASETLYAHLASLELPKEGNY